MTETDAKPGSLECPTMVSVNGGSAAMAIIEELHPKACRLRSIHEFAIGDAVKFDFTLRGAKKLELAGRVLTSTQNGTRRTYTVSLDVADEAEIVVALDAAQRFSVAHPIHDVHTGNGLTRSSARIPVDIELTYTLAGKPPQTARATNVSTGGILLNSADDISVGASLELCFSLPGAEHEISVQARVVAHQHESPNYNMAFFNVDPRAREELAAFVAANG